MEGAEVKIIKALLGHIESITCTHQNTHRGGVLWEICDDCGAQWADDRGGKPLFKWPKCVLDAEKFLSTKNPETPSVPDAFSVRLMSGEDGVWVIFDGPNKKAGLCLSAHEILKGYAAEYAASRNATP